MWDLRAGIREFCEKKASQGSQMSNGREILLLMRLSFTFLCQKLNLTLIHLFKPKTRFFPLNELKN